MPDIKSYTDARLRWLADGISLPVEYLECALPVINEIVTDKAELYLDIQRDLKSREKHDRLIHALGHNEDLSQMSIYLLLALDSYDLYRSRGLEDRIYFDSMKEITVWSKSNEKNYGVIGIRDQLDWISRFFTNELVRLVRLEFEVIDYPLNLCWNKYGLWVKPGDRVINIHIPEDGGLRPDDVAASFRKAYEYFGCTGLQVFVCSTWIIWPKNREFMDPSSNILAFMDNFDIIAAEEAKNHRDLWRIFGRAHREYSDDLPQETGLQKRLAEYLRNNGGVMGRGFGIFAHDGERIYR